MSTNNTSVCTLSYQLMNQDGSSWITDSKIYFDANSNIYIISNTPFNYLLTLKVTSSYMTSTNTVL